MRAIAVLAIAALPASSVAQNAVRVEHFDVYAVKFVCGEFDKRAPPRLGPAEGPVKPGNYQTAINVHNPNADEIRFTKKAVLLFEGEGPLDNPGPGDLEQPQPPGDRVAATLPPDWGLEIDCIDIRKVLLGRDPQPGAVLPFIKGFVVIERPLVRVAADPQVSDVAFFSVPAPLDVVAVYTAHGFTGVPPVPDDEGFSIDVERVTATRAVSVLRPPAPRGPRFDVPPDLVPPGRVR